MTVPNQHSFSVENLKVPGNEEVFGPKYAGVFTIRRPSLGDKQDIAFKKGAAMAVHGIANPAEISESIRLSTHIFAFFTTVSVGKLPDWFDPERVFSEKDEMAVYAAWKAVGDWLDASFPG